MSLPSLPPAFNLIVLDREVPAFERAVRAAPRGVDDGTLYWTERTDRLDLAVVVEPEAAAVASLQALYVLTVAVGDALGALLPPVVPVAFAWPNDLILAGAKVGRVRAALAPVADPAAPPPWLVLGLCLDVGPIGHDPGLLPDRTSLYDEGAGDVSVVQLLEGVSRHLLHWTSRWLEEGIAPVLDAWNTRCFRLGEAAALTLADGPVTGRIQGLDTHGAFRVGDRRLDLMDHLEMLA